MRTITRKRWVVLLLIAVTVTGCKRSPTPSPTPIATAVPVGTGFQPRSGAVVASGEVAPPREVRLGFLLSGWVATVTVARGDAVEVGQVLVTLQTDALDAALAQAEADLAAARAQVALIQVDPHPEEIALLDAQVVAADAAVAQAEIERDRPDLGVTRAEVAAAQAQVAAATADHLVANEIHELTMTCVDIDLPGGETRTVCPALGPMEERARYNMDAAHQARLAAQVQLDATYTGADAEKREIESGIEAAVAQRDVVESQLETLQAGARPEQVAVAQAAVVQAEAALHVARLARDQATLHAPCAGRVIAVETGPGQAVMPGQVVLTVADLDHLQVRTTDLSERDVGQVAIGQPARVYVEGLDATIDGQVTRIASQANTIGGDVVYQVMVDLDDPLPGLRWGMSVEVEILIE